MDRINELVEKEVLTRNVAVADGYKISLTPYAQVFYHEWLLSPNNAQYNILCADQLLSGALDLYRLKVSIQRYVAEHLLLNSHIKRVDERLCWVKNEIIYPLDYAANPISQIDLLAYVNKPFELENGPLYRFLLVRLADKQHRFIVVLHHLLMDGVSLNVGLFQKLSYYYNNENYQEAIGLQEQARLLEKLSTSLKTQLKEHRVEAKTFWQKELSGIDYIDLKFLKLPSTHKNSELVGENPIKEIRFSFEKQEIVGCMEQLKQMFGISPYFYGHCIFAMILYRYTGQERFAVCYPISIKEGLDWSYGGQVNMNLMPYQFTETTKITDLFSEIKRFFGLAVKQSPRHGYYPIPKIIEEAQSKALLDLCFNQAYFRDEHFNFDGVENVEPLYELGVDGVSENTLIFENEPGVNWRNYRVKFDARVIDQQLVLNFIDCYKKLFLDVLKDLVNQQIRQINDYALLTDTQTKAILRLCERDRETGFIAPANKLTLHEIFEEKVALFPDKLALIYQNQTISYRELNEQANQLANYINQNYDVDLNDFILLCVDKSPTLIIAMLAALKVGAAYVPIADYPSARVSHILEDTKPKAILTLQKYRHKFKETAPVIVLDDQQVQQQWLQASTSNLCRKVSPQDLAYVIYTSGTTGKPKGVMQPHCNVIDLFSGTKNLYQFNEKDVWVLFHACVFDFSVWEIFGALLYGGKLVIPTEQTTKDSILFHGLCYREKVTILSQTPTAFYQFMHVAIENKSDVHLDHLRYIIFGGEALNFSALAAWYNHYSDKQPCLVNMYGVTETTVVMTYKKLSEKDVSCDSSLIGFAFTGKKGYLLDANLSLVPLGAVGELYASGGVAKGYLNRPALTQERFISNPFCSNGGDNLLYKTGDLVRMLPDGEFEYMGRKDSQVKLRGHRIELASIEHILSLEPAIEQAVVVVKTTKNAVGNQLGKQYLAAYYISSSALTISYLKDYVKSKLPDFMCPDSFVHLRKFPKTVNGKIDLAALPEPEFKSQKPYKPPSCEQERLVCEAFSTVLGVDRVGINDNFFELGGNSIKAINLALKLQQCFDIKVAEIFALKTPKNIATNKLIGSNLLKAKLKNVKAFFKKHANPSVNGDFEEKVKRYQTDVSLFLSCLPKNFSTKPIESVLLTGSTGYLGCNILNQLLKITNYKIYIFVRSINESTAMDKVEKKYRFYFNRPLISQYAKRLKFICGDLEKNKLGMDRVHYLALVKKIDSIIHCAALVKHYGEKSQFYSANVGATKNLLLFSSLTKLRDFHYISTCSVANFIDNLKTDSRLFTENDFPDESKKWDNIYNQTKLLGESEVLKARSVGIKGSIYRVGNLALMAENCSLQENLEDNAFVKWLRFLQKLGCLSDEIGNVQISQTDLTAEAIVKLFDKVEISSGVHHVFNSKMLSLSSLFDSRAGEPLENLPLVDFIDRIIDYLEDSPDCILAGKFLLRQGWLDDDGIIDKTRMVVLQDKTESILKHLGFEWPKVSGSLLDEYFSQIFA